MSGAHWTPPFTCIITHASHGSQEGPIYPSDKLDFPADRHLIRLRRHVSHRCRADNVFIAGDNRNTPPACQSTCWRGVLLLSTLPLPSPARPTLFFSPFQPLKRMCRSLSHSRSIYVCFSSFLLLIYFDAPPRLYLFPMSSLPFMYLSISPVLYFF